jgi:large subunit ribosomal protein L19e
MMDLEIQKRIAAEVLKCGRSRIWMDPEKLGEISEAITREDIRGLIEEGIIKRKQKKGISSARKREGKEKKRIGRRKGHGSRKGSKGARRGKKRIWVKKIRLLRKKLRELRDDGTIDRRTYRILYRKAKGGEFKSVSHLKSHLQK